MHEVELFSVEECAKIRDRIHDLRPSWSQRELTLEHDGKTYKEKSFTLGTTTYFEARKSQAHYEEKAKETNALLRQNFGWIYDRLSGVIAKVAGKPVIYDDALALPGFHIFLASKVFELPVAPIHFDVHHILLDWEGKDVAFENTISFTASISLPKGGAGLNVWDLTSREIEGKTYEEIGTIVEQRKKTFIQYSVGKMIVHSGQIIHQIAPWKDVSEEEERITLQGQGIQLKDSYLLYW